MAPLTPAVAERQGGVFTFRQALDAGHTRSAVRTALATGCWVRMWRGVLADVSVAVDPASPLRALLLVHPDAVASHATAAALHGFDVGDDVRIHVTVPRESSLRSRSGLVVSHRPISRAVIAKLSGLAVTDVYRTLVDIAATLPRDLAVAFADAALTRERCVGDRLEERLALLDQQPGSARARRALALARYGAESPGETRLRLCLCDRGVPEPVLQCVVDGGRRRLRLDLGWPDAKVGVEYDGFAPHTERSTFVTDRRRHNTLRDVGWEVRSYTGADLSERPDEVASEVLALIGRRVRRQ